MVKSYENADLDLNLSLPAATGTGTARPAMAGSAAQLDFAVERQLSRAAPKTGESLGKSGSLGQAGASLVKTTGDKKFNGQNDTESKTSREALRNAKDQNGVPRSQQPDKTIKPNTPEGDKAGLDNRNVKQQEYTNSQGQKVVIRQDKPAKYPDGGTQPAHFNAGQNPQKPKDLNQHHNYKLPWETWKQ